MSEDAVKEYGMTENKGILVLSIIGEIEGHDNISRDGKTTKYEHMLPLLAKAENSDEIKGILFLINTVGGDVSAGLALAEMVAGMSKPTVSLVIGDSHSIGVPLAVATDYSFIVPTATVIIHPVRMSGTILGARQTYRQFQSTQDRIIGFIEAHSKCTKDRLEKMMMETTMMAKDLGTVLVGKEAVDSGIISEEGNIKKAYDKLYSLIGNANSVCI
ncbi:MAG: ClpP family protease [Butyrivibrio sp.]